MISRCREIRDRTMNRSEWRSEKTTDATNRGYLRTYVTSIDAARTVLSVATAERGVEDDGRSAVAGAVKVQTMCPDVDEPPWWPRGLLIHSPSLSQRALHSSAGTC
jgi:hypothetical protein